MAPSLSVLLYHGPKRTNESKLLHSHDVIITSYQTLSTENQKEFSPLYDKNYPFRRIVLDEAHLIKNKETKSHKACCELIGKKRWCLTGTPIQNKIDELYSLFKFLGVNKYENLDIWNVKINSLINAKNKEDVSKGLKKLHLILDKFMIRRTKQILIDNNVLTVTKTIHTEILDFIPFERKIYNKVKDRIISQILEKNIELDDKNNGELHSNDNIKLDYMSALAYLLRLRQLCCHWELLFNIKQQYDDDSLLNEIKNSIIPEKSSSSEKDFNNALNDEDYEDILKLMKDMNIDENKKINNEDNLNDDDLKFNSTNSIKLQRILNILKNDDKENPRKTIIFSEFTSMLDILSKTLFDNNIKFVRYDGKMDKKSKDETLTKLKNDKHVHVLLCSLKCGAYGLNITSCSRIILYEPFWNPAIGSQAIDRSYRIGQIHNVDVHEFFISDTIEIRIQELQNKKRQLMEAVVDKDAKSTLKMISNGLSKQELFSLLGF
jgi:SNF2 family DNA or RNA helicase